uniref:Uncharacterized protein n=1 Tax=Physcomitrium patens TaxID=3218 RepID=A0A2K1IMN4_PHYPA|nr:hypothetical protein PHYPA_026852 [Physcomitrium patens]
MHLLRVQECPTLQQLKQEERLLRSTSCNRCLINQDRKHSDFICGVKDHLPSHEGFGNSVPHAFEQQFFT